jgi:SAM-dependent methyltransferase
MGVFRRYSHRVGKRRGRIRIRVINQEVIMEFRNSYEDMKRAEAYSKMEFPGTYYLAYRDLPAIIAKHVKGKRAIDFGCGAGRSSRFLKKHGFDVTGIDISGEMIIKAKELDPSGDYRLIRDSDFSLLPVNSFDLVLSVFTFDNIPGKEQKIKIFKGLRGLLNKKGTLVSLVSRPEIYVHEWASFSTKDYPENKFAKCGDKVRIIQTDIEDTRPVEDIVWPDENYREIFKALELNLVAHYAPLGKESEPYKWVNETKIAPWMIYVLGI